MSKLHVKHNLIELSFLHTCKPACFLNFSQVLLSTSSQLNQPFCVRFHTYFVSDLICKTTQSYSR